MTEKQIKEYRDYVKARIMCISFYMSQLTPDTSDVYKNDDEEWLTETNCVWLGTGDIGEMSYNKLTLICISNSLKLRILTILLFLAIIL